jgi:hypothetical protein
MCNERESDRQRSSLILCNSLRSNSEKEEYVELCTGDARRGIIWWKIGVRMISEQEICPICSKEDWCPTLRCGGTKIWKHQILDKRFRNVDAETAMK